MPLIYFFTNSTFMVKHIWHIWIMICKANISRLQNSSWHFWISKVMCRSSRNLLSKTLENNGTCNMFFIFIFFFTWYMYRSKGDIHLYCTGPPRAASSGKCTTRCSITSQNKGGKIFFKLQSFTAMFSFKMATSLFFSIFAEISQKKSDISIQNIFELVHAY